MRENWSLTLTDIFYARRRDVKTLLVWLLTLLPNFWIENPSYVVWISKITRNYNEVMLQRMALSVSPSLH